MMMGVMWRRQKGESLTSTRLINDLWRCPSIEKFPLVYESDKTRDSLSWRLWCYFEAQVWQRIVTLSLLSFSLIFFIFLTWDNALENDDHHTSIYLQLNDYNSILEQSMTLYECLRRCTGICNEPRVTCMKIMKMALPQIRCQLHDHAKSNMTMMMRVI